MKKFGTNQSVKRVEDQSLLRGEGRFVSDICPKNAVYVHFYRSPVAHAKIENLNVDKAAKSKGVLAVFTAHDLKGKLLNSMNFDLVKNKNGKAAAAPIRPILAEHYVRFVGEAIAAVVASSKKAAEDAVELIEIDFCEYDAHIKTVVGGPTIHHEAPDNKAVDWEFGDQASTEKAFRDHPHEVTLNLIDNRVLPNPIETRVCFAECYGSELHFCFAGQGVWKTRDALAKKLFMKKSQIRVTTPDVGGGFGMKAFDYPEYFIVALAARELKKAVYWQAERREGILSDNGGRDLVTEAKATFDTDYNLVAIRVDTTFNLGAYNSTFGQKIQTELALKVLTGVYDVQTVYFSVEGVFTNTPPIDAYRGAGRPEAIYVIERLMDFAARKLDIDPFELRKKNFIKKEMMPYRAASGELYDVGDFEGLLQEAILKADVKGFSERKKDSAKKGKLRGIGLCFYIESILGDQNETTKIEFNNQGGVNLYVGTQSNGQGHATVFAQILHHRSGIPFEKISIIQGDSKLIQKGGGTGGSRSVTMQGNSINSTADIMIKKLSKFAANQLDAHDSEIKFSDGTFFVPDTNKHMSIMETAATAVSENNKDILITEYENYVPARSFPYGAHFAELEVDPETGKTECVKYTVVDDFGILMNPMLVEGQVHGGVAQGIGQAISEHVVFDDTGQVLTGTLMDYAMPRANDVPAISFYTKPVPSIANDIGMKGCGEAGTVGALAAIGNAALDAVYDLGVRQIDMPFTPNRMWSFINQAIVNDG